MALRLSRNSWTQTFQLVRECRTSNTAFGRVHSFTAFRQVPTRSKSLANTQARANQRQTRTPKTKDDVGRTFSGCSCVVGRAAIFATLGVADVRAELPADQIPQTNPGIEIGDARANLSRRIVFVIEVHLGLRMKYQSLRQIPSVISTVRSGERVRNWWTLSHSKRYHFAR